MSTLLHYGVITDPFPLQASAESGPLTTATLTLVATNNTADAVTLQGIIITLPVGDDATDLTDNAAGIGPVPPPNWTLHDTQHPTGFVKYLFYPNSGHGSVGKGQEITFVFNNIAVNRTPGTFEAKIEEGSNDCQPPDCPTATLDVTKFPHGWGTVAFWTTPSPPIVPYDEPKLYLHWAGPSGATYGIDYYTPQTGIVTIPKPEDPPLANSGQYPASSDPGLALRHNTTFYLSVSEIIAHDKYHAQQQVTATVEIPSPTITLFTAEMTAFDSDARTMSVRLHWKAENTNELHIDGVGIFKDDEARQHTTDVNSSAVSPTTYVATAYGLPGYDGNPASRQTQITLQEVQINTFTASKDPSASGQTALVLSWDVAHAVSISIEPGGPSHKQALPGPMRGCTVLGSPSQTAYTLKAGGYKPLTRQVKETEPPDPKKKVILSTDPTLGCLIAPLKTIFKTEAPCLYTDATALTFGWDTVFILGITEANAGIKHGGAWPLAFQGEINDSLSGKLTLTGQFAAWQIVPGGDGALLRMAVPIQTGTLTATNLQHSIAGATAIIEVQLSSLPPPSTAPNSADPAVVIITIHTQEALSELLLALVKELLQSWFNKHLKTVNQVLSAVNLTLHAQTCPSELKPTTSAYAFLDTGPAGDGFFGVLTMTQNRSAADLPRQLDPRVLPSDVQALFLTKH